MKQLMWIPLALALLAGGWSNPAGAVKAEELQNLRPFPVDEEREPPRMLPMRDSAVREVRNYPEQPPVIPHSIEGYQVDLRANKCMTCHARVKVGTSQAPMVSITHYQNREGQMLATVSPRRYFCTQCHVPVYEQRPPVDNTFISVDELIEQGR